MSALDWRESTSEVPSGNRPNQSITVDFDTTNVTAADVITLTNLKAESLYAVVVEVTTGEGATATVDLATGETSPQVFLSNASIETTGTELIGDGADGDAALVWIYVPADTTLKMTVDHNMDAAVLEVKLFRLYCPD